MQFALSLSTGQILMLQSNIVVSCLLLNLLFVMLDEYIFLYLYCRCSWELLLLLLLLRISTVEIVFTIWQFSCDSTLWSIIWRLLKNRLNDYELLLLDSIRFNVKDYRQYFFCRDEMRWILASML